MTLKQDISNDPILSDAAFQVTQIGRKLPELLRDGRIAELETQLCKAIEEGKRGVYRISALGFAHIPLPDGYKK